MKVLLSWLRELAPFDQSPEAIADAFNDLGTPVEEETRLGEGLDGIVVARVLELRPHPKADRIQLVDVDAGDGEALQIACGAFNMAVGDLVPLATLGTTMPDGMEIARRKMRGEWSNGMLCSSREIGLGTDHGGIKVLPAGLTPGTPLVEALGIEADVLWDLEVNANRPDALSVAGLARDLAARFGVPFALDVPVVPTAGAPAGDALAVEILDPDLCGRFGAWLLRGLDPTATSPEWMQQRLTHLGMRPISALVDISNYVMLERGQPNHPYDLAGVPGGTFRVRRARPGERLTTLDDVQRELRGDDLLICGGDDVPLGIAGVMGGASAEITATTTDVALEMAWFLPRSVGTTARRLGLRTEAAARFERGCDPEGIDGAAARFAQLAAEICGTELAPGAVDGRGELPARDPIRVRTARVNHVLGTSLAPDEVVALLDPIGFASTPVGDGDLDVTVPSWRYDSESEVDVVEEVARHHGYDRIPRRELAVALPGRLTPVQRRRREVRRLMVGRGLTEVMPLPFLAPGALAACGFPPDGIELRNSLVAEESILRTTLMPGLVQAVATNAARRSLGVRLFEIGHVFLPKPDEADGRTIDDAVDGPGRPDLLPDEREHLGVALAGVEAPEAVRLALAVLDRLGIDDVDIANAERPGLHPTRGATVLVAGDEVGVAGEVDPGVLGAHGIDERVAWVELDLGRLLAAVPEDEPYRPVSRFPSSDVDLAFEVPAEVSARAVEATLAAASDLVWSVDLFDTYRGSGVAEGARSLAYRVRFVSLDRTLTDAEVGVARQALIDAVTTAHGATLRG
ncbi:phenylalanine--tRNA ligase subunit beta [Iamia sp. SCSIO 61187]|uniref:phenylalanine--tRNA ligase subunit beta n=1 Tax=Iamia sp. SCSIO 61187 TaxID=2722752 RepID=UPI001C626A54|nr:phenylalanine--tRNA ligase subunit beta [Iamia sp. SCSIO 61187]QYG93055.1 phenylalanine--tRNA ligase subunit beta [Iamia sp. SCSIO 61187]